MNYLHHAAKLASQISPHHTAPNPRVGCVIVHDNKIISEGVHEEFGASHAEQNAIHNLNSSPFQGEARRGILHNDEIYLTLEPCDHFPGKKTPSCTDLLIQAKPKKIIVGSLDPQFKGQNIAKLRSAGIDVVVEENKECEALNPFFKKYITTPYPYLTLKIAQSLDGKIVNPHDKWITNEQSRHEVHKMRAQYSAILTTTKTILSDNPHLTCRQNKIPPLSKGRLGGVSSTTLKNTSHPHLIILGKKTDIPPTANIFKNTDRKMLFFDNRDITEVLKECHRQGTDSIMTECGGTMNTAILKSGHVDEINLFVAPRIIGNHMKNSFSKNIVMKRFQWKQLACLGNDILCVYKSNLSLPSTSLDHNEPPITGGLNPPLSNMSIR